MTDARSHPAAHFSATIRLTYQPFSDVTGWQYMRDQDLLAVRAGRPVVSHLAKPQLRDLLDGHEQAAGRLTRQARNRAGCRRATRRSCCARRRPSRRIRAALGVVLGGSGNGEQIMANKVKGIRAALVWNEDTAVLARQQNDVNVISLGARQHRPATRFLEAFLDCRYSGELRHQRRTDMFRGRRHLATADRRAGMNRTE
jgi:hypothetical protein